MNAPWPQRLAEPDCCPGVGELAWARVGREDDPVKIVAQALDRTTGSNHPPATGPFRWWALVQDVSGQRL